MRYADRYRLKYISTTALSPKLELHMNTVYCHLSDRFKWPTPDDDYFREQIAQGEGSTIEYRIQRCRFLWEEFGPPAHMLLTGGIASGCAGWAVPPWEP